MRAPARQLVLRVLTIDRLTSTWYVPLSLVRTWFVPLPVCDHSQGFSYCAAVLFSGFTSLLTQETEYIFPGLIPTNKQTNKKTSGTVARLLVAWPSNSPRFFVQVKCNCMAVAGNQSLRNCSL